MVTHGGDKATRWVAIIGVLIGPVLGDVDHLTEFHSQVRAAGEVLLQVTNAPPWARIGNLPDRRETIENREPGVVKIEQSVIRIRAPYLRLFRKKAAQSIQPCGIGDYLSTSERNRSGGPMCLSNPFRSW